jgi:hypothetical protein
MSVSVQGDFNQIAPTRLDSPRKQVGRTHKIGNEGTIRPLKNRLRSVDLFDAAPIHHRDAVAKRQRSSWSWVTNTALDGIASFDLVPNIAGPSRTGDGVQAKIGGPQCQTRSVISSTPDETSVVGWRCHLLDHSSAEQRAHDLPGGGDRQGRRIHQPILPG